MRLARHQELVDAGLDPHAIECSERLRGMHGAWPREDNLRYVAGLSGVSLRKVRRYADHGEGTIETRARVDRVLKENGRTDLLIGRNS